MDIYELQKHAVIVCAEGVVDEKGQELGAELTSTDPAGNKILSGAAEALRQLLIKRLGDSYFTSKRRNESARLTAGSVHATDPSNASRTLLFDITKGAWSDELCELLHVPTTALPEVRPNSGDFGRSNPDAFLRLDRIASIIVNLNRCIM